jgi:RNA polymerase sigma factor (sigma-70 family)
MNMTAPRTVAASTPSPAVDLAVQRERKLVEAARAGDGKAFAALVRPHLPLLYRLAARACGDASLAEDAVQEALDLTYQRLDRYEPGTSMRAFLASMTVRRAKTLARAERRRKVREDASATPQQADTPAELMGAADLKRRVVEALAELPEKRREAAMLRLDGGLSHAEIAEALGSTERSVRVMVHLALKDLRGKLSDMFGGDRPSQPEVASTATRSAT